MNSKKSSLSTPARAPISIALIGECMIELQNVPGQGVQQSFGGDTLNTAIYMARLGRNLSLRVDYVTALGTDRFSRAMAAFWEKEGVGSSLVQRIEGKLPGLYFIQLDDSGERSFFYWRGESAARRCFEYEGSANVLAGLEDYDAIYLSGISLAILEPRSLERLLARLEKLHGLGKAIHFDFNYRPHLWASREETVACYARVCALSHTVLLSREEGVSLLGRETAQDLHAYFRGLGAAESVVRDGQAPCSACVGDQVYRIAAREAVDVVDTTAAGDSFSAAYLVARLFGHGVEQAAALGHSLAASVISRQGAVIPMSGMPEWDMPGM